MENTVTKINFKKTPKKIDEEYLVIGKDILELLVNGMYVNPLTIYREYVQNSADSIDEAKEAGLDVNQSRIKIQILHAERTVKIRDYGHSLSNEDFIRVITALGASHKRGLKLRGFRGVGRLSGLGFCQQLIFRGKTEKDKHVMEVTWDGRLLKQKIRDSSYTGNLREIVKEIVTHEKVVNESQDERFFEVEMRKVIRVRNDLLLNEDQIKGYLSEVAPVPFDPKFKYAKKITSKLLEYGIDDSVEISINDEEDIIHNRMKNEISYGLFTKGHVSNVSFKEFKNSDGEVIAIGWFGDHQYLGSLLKKDRIGGLRMRSGNIQVGDETLLTEIFPESRFNGWVIGDIHVLSDKVIPNGRRDNFEPSPRLEWLLNEIRLLANEFAKTIRSASVSRNKLVMQDRFYVEVEKSIELCENKELNILIRKALVSVSEERLNNFTNKLGLDLNSTAQEQERLKKVKSSVKRVSGKLKRSKAQSGIKQKSVETKILKALVEILDKSRAMDEGIMLSDMVIKAFD